MLNRAILNWKHHIVISLSAVGKSQEKFFGWQNIWKAAASSFLFSGDFGKSI